MSSKEWTKIQSPQRQSLPTFSFLFQEPLDSHAMLGCVLFAQGASSLVEPIAESVSLAPTLHEWHFWELLEWC